MEEDGWVIFEKFLDKKINFELRLIELFILSISAGIIILSLSEYKLIIISVILQILCVIWTIITLILDLKQKKDEKSIDSFKKIPFVISIPFGINELLIFVLYILSILFMGVIIILPYLK